MSCRGVVSALLCVIAVSTVQADVVSVAVVGPGTGTVESSPPGISCPGTCSARFPSGSQVTLTATADQGSRFDTWSAACGGSASGCTVSVRPNLGVIASFRATGDPHSVVHHFAPPVVDGAYPASGRPVSDGTWLYGTTLQGGLNGVGTIYRQRLDGSDFEVLHSFSSSATTGSEPRGSLTLDGTVLYGTTLRGGAADAGTVFRIGTDGSDFAVLHSFSGSTGDGSSPRGALAIGDGVLYGTTSRGGASGFGTVFRIDSDGSDFALLHSFTTSGADGSEPEGSLVLDGGVLYGMTPRGGASDAGTVFRIGADGSGFATLHSFSGTASDGANPYGSLTLAGDVLYGMTSDGGPSGDGTVFRIGTGGSGFALLHSFAGSAIEGARPYGSLTLSGQSLYGMTRYGGEWGKGTVFSIHTDGSDFTSLHVFSGGTADRNPDGGEPLGSLALVGGVLYGATSSGGPPGDGTVFTLKTNGSDFALLHSFGSPVSDGRRPLGSLIADGGALYGMTSRGGVSDLGAIFRVGADGSDFSVLHSFRRADGRSPHGSLTLVDDVLYGMTRGGGAADAGAIFRIDVDGSGFAVLHAFSGGPDDGDEPWGTLTPYGGSLFGTTSRGGASDLGTVFRIDTDGSDFALLHSFAGGAVDGASPLGGLTAESGVLYGMTRTGGASGVGTLFRIDTDGSDFALLHSFGLALSDGRYPFGSLVADEGVLYGMTSMGGDTGFYGAVFRIDTDGTDFALLHSFTGSPFDGDTPLGSLTLAGGVLYGTTSGGGVADPGTLTGDGTVFRINPDGTGFEVLHSFGSDPATGRVPMYGSLVADGGFLYGMTSRGGDSDEGAVFRIDPAGTVVEPVHSFGSPGGRSPSGSLASDGDALYGMTELGGTWDAGTLYSVDRDGSDFAILHSFPPSGDASARPRFSLTPGGGGPVRRDPPRRQLGRRHRLPDRLRRQRLHLHALVRELRHGRRIPDRRTHPGWGRAVRDDAFRRRLGCRHGLPDLHRRIGLRGAALVLGNLFGRRETLRLTHPRRRGAVRDHRRRGRLGRGCGLPHRNRRIGLRAPPPVRRLSDGPGRAVRIARPGGRLPLRRLLERGRSGRWRSLPGRHGRFRPRAPALVLRRGRPVSLRIAHRARRWSVRRDLDRRSLREGHHLPHRYRRIGLLGAPLLQRPSGGR